MSSVTTSAEHPKFHGAKNFITDSSSGKERPVLIYKYCIFHEQLEEILNKYGTDCPT
jgi:hypothetical protein